MKLLLCKDCIGDEPVGVRKVLERNVVSFQGGGGFTEPAEFLRVTRGVAGQPTREQRTIYVNGVAQPVMDLSYYNCDSCNGKILPGEACATKTAWTERQSEPEMWELQYFQKP